MRLVIFVVFAIFLNMPTMASEEAKKQRVDGSSSAPATIDHQIPFKSDPTIGAAVSDVGLRALLFLGGAALLAFFIVRVHRSRQAATGAFASTNEIKVLARKRLDSNAYTYVLDIDGQRLVVINNSRSVGLQLLPKKAETLEQKNKEVAQ